MPCVSFWMPLIWAPKRDWDVVTQPEAHAHAADSTVSRYIGAMHCSVDATSNSTWAGAVADRAETAARNAATEMPHFV